MLKKRIDNFLGAGARPDKIKQLEAMVKAATEGAAPADSDEEPAEIQKLRDDLVNALGHEVDGVLNSRIVSSDVAQGHVENVKEAEGEQAGQ